MNLKYSFLVLLIGCGEKAVTINNTAPEVTITSHEDGDVAFTDVAIEFRASVSDANDDFVDLEEFSKDSFPKQPDSSEEG